MAHTLDTSLYISGTANPLTSDYTCGVNATLLTLGIGCASTVGTTNRQSAGRGGGAPSFGGKIFSQVCVSAGNLKGAGMPVQLWYIENPSVGAAYSISIPNTGTVGGRNIHAFASSYCASAWYTSVLDTSAKFDSTAIRLNTSTNITTTVNNELLVSVYGAGGLTATTLAYPGRFVTPVTDRGNAQCESAWYVQPTATNVSVGFSWATTNASSGLVVGAFKEVPKYQYGAILKIYDGFSWRECASIGVKLYNGSTWKWCASRNVKIMTPAGWLPVRMDGSMAAAANTLLSGLIAYYNCDDTTGLALDSHTGNYDASLVGSVARGGGGGLIVNHYTFDGVSEVRVGEVAALKTSQLTLSAWLRTGTSSYLCVASMIDGTLTAGYSMTTEATKIRVKVADNAAHSAQADSTTSVNTSAWVHCVMTSDGTNLKLYVNGTQEGGSQSFPYNIGYSTGANGTFRIGARGDTPAQYFIGDIDEVGIWNRALTSTEITTLYNSGSGKAYPFT